MSVRCNCDYYGAKSVSPWSSLDYTTPPPTGINTINETGTQLAIFPNPAKDKFTLYVSSASKYGGSIQVTDISGKQLKSLTIINEYTDVEVAGLTPGLYLIKYIDKNGSKIIKLNKE